MHQVLLETTWHLQTGAPQESGTALMTSRISNTMYALLIIIKDLKTASLNELFILLSSSILPPSSSSIYWLAFAPSSSCFSPYRLLIFRLSVKPSYWGAFRDTSEVSRDACQTIHFQPGWSGWPSRVTCCMLLPLKVPPAFSQRGNCRHCFANQPNPLKARKHAVRRLDPDFFAFDSCLGDLSADRDVEFALLIVSWYLCSKKQQSLRSRLMTQIIECRRLYRAAVLKILLRMTVRYNAWTVNIANWNIGRDAVVWTRKNNLEQQSRYFKIATYLFLLYTYWEILTKKLCRKFSYAD